FRGGLRQGGLNEHCFLSRDDAGAKIGAGRGDYNETRPHSAREWATPTEFARRSRLQATAAKSEEPESSTSERY
ncbi:integrase core domain-containing protein, partial [Nostoc sp. NIES-2111]